MTGIADFWVSKATIDTAIRKLCTLTKNNYNGGTFSNFFPSLDWDDRRFLSNKFCNYSSTIVRDKYLGKQWNLLQELALYESPSCGTQECARLQELHLKWYDAVYELANQLRHSDEALHIDNVIPPDEYHDHVNDSVYTNSVAKYVKFTTPCQGNNSLSFSRNPSSGYPCSELLPWPKTLAFIRMKWKFGRTLVIESLFCTMIQVTFRYCHELYISLLDFLFLSVSQKKFTPSFATMMARKLNKPMSYSYIFLCRFSLVGKMLLHATGSVFVTDQGTACREYIFDLFGC